MYFKAGCFLLVSFAGETMSTLSPHLREQKFGRRRIVFSLKDAMNDAGENGGSESELDAYTAAPDTKQDSTDLKLHYADGSTESLPLKGFELAHAKNDIFTQVYVASPKRKRLVLGAITNRSQRARARTETLGVLLRKTGVTRSLGWWWSVLFLSIAAIITDFGFFSHQISAQINPVLKIVSDFTAPFVKLVSIPIEAVCNWLPLSIFSAPIGSFATFGSLQDHSFTFFITLLLMVFVIWARSWRLFSVPALALCLFTLKSQLFGYDSAQYTVFIWYAPVLIGLLVIGAINRLRDRARLAMRLSAICKSLIAQPLPPNLVDTLLAAKDSKKETGADDQPPPPPPPAEKTSRHEDAQLKITGESADQNTGQSAGQSTGEINALPRPSRRRRRH